MKDIQNLFNKVYGTLMGVALGDAMGMPCEFFTRNKSKMIFGGVDGFLPSPNENFITGGFGKYEVTDDTQQTFIVAKAIIENKGKIIPEEIIKRIIDWSKEDKMTNKNIIGPSTRKAFELISQGTSLEEAGKFGDTNGGAMRIVPVGIVSDWKSMDSLVENVRLACLPTHNTNTAISGSAAVAAAVSAGIDGKEDIEELIEISKIACLKGLEKGNELPGASIAKRIDLGIKIVKNGESEESILQELYDIIGAGMATTESVPAAFALVYMSNGDPVKCAKLSANLGGDTDTIGAMSCGICGAVKGIDAIDVEYIKNICEVNKLPAEEIAMNLTKIRYKMCK